MYEVMIKDEATSPEGVTRVFSVPGTLLSVGICRNNFMMYRASGGTPSRVSGRGFQARLAVPMDDDLIEYSKALPCCMFAAQEFDGPCL
jgi:hypothetical protein